MDRDQPIRNVWPPEPGYFRLRLVKGGWAAPAMIEFADGMWQASIDGIAYPPHEDPVIAGVDRIWHYGTFSSRREYLYLNELREWSRVHRPTDPCADATQPISKRRLRPIIV